MFSFLPMDSKFACVSLRGSSRADLPAEQLFLGEGFWALGRAPFELEIMWGPWLGSIEAETLASSNLLLFTAHTSKQLDRLDGENVELCFAVDYLLYTLILQGLDYDHGFIATGAHREDRINIQRFLTLRQFHPSPVGYYASLREPAFKQAALAAAGLQEVYRVAGEGGGGYARLRRGFNALMRAFEEDAWDARLHQFVRAIEALLPPTCETGTDFARCAQLFVGRSAEARSLLEELHGLRMDAERMRDPLPRLSTYADPPGTAGLRSLQAEVIASRTYLRLLSEAEMHERFRMAGSVQPFWTGQDRLPDELWGEPIDVQAVIREIYRPDEELY